MTVKMNPMVIGAPMIRRFVARVLFVLVALFAGGALDARASLVSLDYLSSGDGLLTRDTVSALDWLDVTRTVNQTYDQVRTGSYYTDSVAGHDELVRNGIDWFPDREGTPAFRSTRVRQFLLEIEAFSLTASQQDL